MATPNFTGARSLYQSSAHYRGTATFGCAEGTAQLAVKDPTCINRCSRSCASECADLFGGAKSACINACSAEAAACRAQCPDVPAPPPPPPPPPRQYPPRYTSKSTECTREVAQTQCQGFTFFSMNDCIQNCGGYCIPEAGIYRCCHDAFVCVSSRTCTQYEGPCTGINIAGLVSPGEGYCVTSPTSGQTKCTYNWSELPWIRECDDGTTRTGTNFCIW
jgi:hypothetical protein